MCGIAGIFNLNGKGQIDLDLLNAMNQAQFHRGPDEGGVWVDEGIGLAHRRLSIIDLSSAGRQPMSNEDGSVMVVFNGEIFDFQAIREELIKAGHIFKSHSDTEVIVHGWEEWGEKCIERFRGMFGIAIWDAKKKQLFMARDRLGIKPVFYTITPEGTLLFGSELKVLYQYKALKKEIDPQCVEDYFAFGYVPEPKTIFKNIYKLEPGWTLTINVGDSKPRLKQYWNIPFKTDHQLSYDDASKQLTDQMKQAIGIRMIADVPLGAFLSGGVDSSSVVALMSQQQNEPVNTCSISFNDPKFNESEFAQQVAERYHTNHFVETVDTDDFGLIDKLAELYDEPYADSSAIPTYRVCELARKRVTVALSGDGADESLSGYRRHVWHMNEEMVRNRIPYGFRRAVFGFLGRVYPKLDWMPRIFRAKTTFQALARNSVEAYFNTISILKDDQRVELYSDAFKKQLNGYNAIEVFNRHASECPSSHPLNLIEYLDLKTYLPGDILTKVDRASMAHALEVRVPLLDHKLIEWISNLPPEFKIKGQVGKYILKNTMEPHLPEDILYRPKMGFAVPLASWFRGPLKSHVRKQLLGERLLSTGYFNKATLQKLVNDHETGKRDYSAPIWTLLMFDSFLGKVMDGTAV
ncbi:MAG: amidotransferase 1, exosortase A system-associated [Hahellaceae bacterium]|nr:amidotransferase 1, exosortase A system-associated [Hahellaceae bacterium]